LNSLPDSLSTPELHIHTAEGEHHALVEQLKQTAQFCDALEIITLDGMRVEYADGFGLARPSNTSPTIMLRFEADTTAALTRIQNDFRRIFQQAAPHLKLPF
ncbi:MAG: phosphomannomutase/phosphoglucomutase, partial [Gallionellales bacterium CG17_big_fil_post_rev_8_21_14_2_50_54_146]